MVKKLFFLRHLPTACGRGFGATWWALAERSQQSVAANRRPRRREHGLVRERRTRAAWHDEEHFLVRETRTVIITEHEILL